MDNGSSPFEDWLDSIEDNLLVRSIDARITRIRSGNFGDHKSVGGGVFELRVHKRPALRVYYALTGTNLVILLGGGSKSSQKKDIESARSLWRAYKNEN